MTSGKRTMERSGQSKDGGPNRPKYCKWTPEITGMIDRDKYDKTVMGPCEHGVLTPRILVKPVEHL